MKEIFELTVKTLWEKRCKEKVLKVKYNNSVTFSRSIIMTKKNNVMNFSAIAQSQNLLKKKLIKMISLMQTS